MTSLWNARTQTRPSISELTNPFPSGITLMRLLFLRNFQASRTNVTSVSRILRPVCAACAKDRSDLHSASLHPVIVLRTLRGCRLGAMSMFVSSWPPDCCSFLAVTGRALAEEGGGGRRAVPSSAVARCRIAAVVALRRAGGRGVPVASGPGPRAGRLLPGTKGRSAASGDSPSTALAQRRRASSEVSAAALALGGGWAADPPCPRGCQEHCSSSCAARTMASCAWIVNSMPVAEAPFRVTARPSTTLVASSAWAFSAKSGITSLVAAASASAAFAALLVAPATQAAA
mmetsp:Transcript_23477/g.65003  ORF Transcript_23477/g.65003 Transcript_23477/m.65003 type:complete len:288 (-) Transcript_23477:415-1278(-)